MDERQILLVKVSWSTLYKRPELVEESLARQFKKICPQFDNLDKDTFNGLSMLINSLVLNIHTFQNVYSLLNSRVKDFEYRGCTRETFNKLVQAFLQAIEKIHGKAWNIEIKSAWVIVIASISSKYSQIAGEIPPEVILD